MDFEFTDLQNDILAFVIGEYDCFSEWINEIRDQLNDDEQKNDLIQYRNQMEGVSR